MADATYYQDGDSIDYTPVAAVVAGEVLQIYDGRAAVAPAAIAAGAKGALAVHGVYQVLKTANELHFPGQRIYWDESASTATCVPSIVAGDFFLGCCTQDVAAADAVTFVDLNSDPLGTVDQRRDSFASVTTAAAGYPVVTSIGGYNRFVLTATNEAQCVDALSHRAFGLASDWIFYADVCVDAAAAGATDISVGVSDTTSTTDFQGAGSFCVIHLDGASTDISVHSDDSATDVTIADSTINFVAATPFNVVIDGRNPADIGLYINGIKETAAATTLAINIAANGLKAVVHVEKSSSTDTAIVSVGNMKVVTRDL